MCVQQGDWDVRPVVCGPRWDGGGHHGHHEGHLVLWQGGGQEGGGERYRQAVEECQTTFQE